MLHCLVLQRNLEMAEPLKKQSSIVGIVCDVHRHMEGHHYAGNGDEDDNDNQIILFQKYPLSLVSMNRNFYVSKMLD